MRALIAFGALLVGCSGAASVDSSTPRRLYGEVHVHGFAGGSHPGALFLGSATPADRVRGDDILDQSPPPSASAGPCTLFAADCATCPAPPPPIDGGLVRITGGQGIAEVALAFQPRQRAYLPTHPLAGAIFAGGERLTFDGQGAEAPAFHGELDAPAPLVLTQPAARPRLSTGALTVAWVPDRATRIDVALVASTAGGGAAIIECIADDAAGTLVVPAELVAALPPPPRDLQLLVSRDAIAHVASAQPEEGVVLHAGFETRVDWHEDQ